MTIPLKAVIVFWLHSVVVHLERFEKKKWFDPPPHLPHYLHLYFLFANEDLLLDVLFNSKLALT